MQFDADYLIIGAGIIGLATGLRLLQKHPSAKVLILDKESNIAQHQSSHNSGVIHSGLYYCPGSLKASLCISGAKQLLAFCRENEIAVNTCGKLVIARNSDELAGLDELERRGHANGVEGLRRVNPAELKELEPDVVGVAALLSPTTSVVSFASVAEGYAKVFRSLGGEIQLSRPVTAITKEAFGYSVDAGGKTFTCRFLINCAGLYADRMARLAGVGEDLPQIFLFAANTTTCRRDGVSVYTI